MTATSTAAALDLVGAALLEARAAIADDDVVDLNEPQQYKAHDALLLLAHTSYDALVAWEQEHEGARTTAPVPERTPSWRALLEDLRVQLALAEMEVRDATLSARTLAEQSISAVEEGVSGAVHEIGGLVGKLRTELRKVNA